MNSLRNIANTLVCEYPKVVWEATRPHTLGHVALRGIGRCATIGAALLTVGIALKILALTPIGPYLGAVTIIATIGAFPPALLITCAIVTTIGMGLLISYLIEKHAV